MIGARIGARIGTSSSGMATLSVSLTDAPDPVAISTSATYSCIVTNTGTATANNVSAEITISIDSADFVITSATGSGWTILQFGNVLDCTRTSLSAGASSTITIVATASSSAETVTSSVVVMADNAAQVATTQDTTVFVPTTTLTIALTDSVDPVITSVNYTYGALVTNTGSNTAMSVTATITLDASLTFVSGSGTGWSVGASGQTVTCTRSTLAVGAAPAITITVTSGGAALTASSAGDAIASNAPAATTSTQTTVVKLVARDAGMACRVPNSLTQWQDFNAYQVAIGRANYPNVTPASLYLCQEASGNLADSIGAVTLTANNSPTYQQAVTNCTRKGIGFTGGANQRCTAASGTGPNPTTTSQLWLWRLDVTSAPVAQVHVLMVSDAATNYRLLLSTAPVFQNIIGGVTSNGISDPRVVSTQWIDIQYDRANSHSTCHTVQEKITNTFSSLVLDGRKGLGGAASWTGHAVYGVRFDGASAELSDAQIKALHTALNEGTAPSWT